MTYFNLSPFPITLNRAATFLLTEVCEELEMYFTIGKDLDCFKDKNELLEKVQLYLSDFNLREKVAKKGENTVINKFTIESQLLDLLL